MTLIKYISIILILLSIFSCKKKVENMPDCTITNSNPGFEKYYGGTEQDIANSVAIKNDKLYVFGTTKSLDDNTGDHYLLQLGLDGNLVWEKTFGGNAAEEGFKILPTLDDNFLLIGSTESSGNGAKDFHIIKINNSGDLLWEQTYGGLEDDVPANGIETSNGEFCITGSTKSFGFGERDIYTVWIDQNGNLLREKTVGGPLNDGGTELIELENNEIMLYGYTNNFGATSQNMFLLKMNAVGDSLWSQRYGGADYEESQQFARTTDGDFVLNGHSASTDPFHDMYVTKIDANGNQLWEKNYGGAMHDGGQAMIINSVGNYVNVARSMSFNNNRNIYMVTTTPDGNIISEKVIGGDNADWGEDIIEYNGFYYLVGHSNETGNDDVFVVKTEV